MNTTKPLLAAIALTAGLLTATAANATLVSARGGQVVNDTDLNITWLANANLAASNTFGLATGVDLGNAGVPGPYVPSVINSHGTMSWGGALHWIAAMNTANYLGFNDWRLPTSDTCEGYCTGSEMGHLFYNELGGVAGSSLFFSSDPDLALFHNVQSSFDYWSGTEYKGSDLAWGFSMNLGEQFAELKGYYKYALAVRPGQVSEPATLALMGLGFLGVLASRRRKQTLDA